MSLTIRNNDDAFNLPPEGKHIARCFWIFDLGIQRDKNYGSYSPKVLIAWELSELLTKKEKPFSVMQRYTASLNTQSRLRALLESWRGKNFEPDELNEFRLANMLTEPCYLTIEHIENECGKKCLAKVADISPLPTYIPCPDLHNTPISFDLDYYTEENYFSVPENIRKKISLVGG